MNKFVNEKIRNEKVRKPRRNERYSLRGGGSVSQALEG